MIEERLINCHIRGIRPLLMNAFIILVLVFSSYGYCGPEHVNPKKTDQITEKKEWYPPWLDTLDPELTKENLEEFRKFKSSKEYPGMVVLLQFMLWQLGYFGDIPISGTIDDRTKKAIQDYQKQRGLNPTGDMDFETTNKIFKDSKLLNADIVDLPFFYFSGKDPSYVYAKGTWVFEDSTDQAMPLQTTEITCSRKRGICFVGTSRIGMGNLLLHDSDIYEIERWDEHEIVTKPIDFLCVRYVLRINFLQKSVKLYRTTISRTGPCKDVDPKDYTLVLSDGFKVSQEIRKKIDEALSKIRKPFSNEQIQMFKELKKPK